MSWTVNASKNIGIFQLCSCITSGIVTSSQVATRCSVVQYLLCSFPTDQYMAFGISGSNTSTFMVGADVVVAWVDNGVANAVDYYLTSRQQVSNN